MKNTNIISQSETRRSTYSLLVGSEEKSRSLFETLAYSLCILSAAFSIWQAAHQPVEVPSSITTSSIVSAPSAVSDAQRS
jgi:branched-subunit amino acid ABC-type transport system permease component